MIQTQTFSHTNTNVKRYVLTNKNGVCAKITNYGAILTSLKIPLKSGDRDIVLGFDSLEDYQSKAYLKDYPYFGAIIGRFANRINLGKVTIDAKEIQLSTNHGKHLLHGGHSGFDKRVWDAEIIGESKLQLSLDSEDGDQNFPGNMKINIIYELNDENELAIYYSATCDKTSPINLTSHSYFNFTGGKENILNHQLQIDSDKILENNSELIPTGNYIEVNNTAFDFRDLKQIKQNIAQVENYDNCYVLKTEGKNLMKVAELYEESSNIRMEISTDFPGLQLYTGKFINVEGNKKFGPFSGVALETQAFPDAPNQPNFSDGFIHPGEIYEQQTRYQFHF
ncbi:galactose mutarotase [Ancylomarina salipaludis]|uniref:Aldose 1-epimerase n=1 Tax=Ancylomarina salipaludis TaxID=2501299 RepID=A0A4Q1JML7_9BACT|nr:aldose epimerase family protein [Ancylomarina salipaludis]RXQ94529.1 galactose mutarotase [Ancylomarina salipaludis]